MKTPAALATAAMLLALGATPAQAMRIYNKSAEPIVACVQKYMAKETKAVPTDQCAGGEAKHIPPGGDAVIKPGNLTASDTRYRAWIWSKEGWREYSIGKAMQRTTSQPAVAMALAVLALADVPVVGEITRQGKTLPEGLLGLANQLNDDGYFAVYSSRDCPVARASRTRTLVKDGPCWTMDWVQVGDASGKCWAMDGAKPALFAKPCAAPDARLRMSLVASGKVQIKAGSRCLASQGTASFSLANCDSTQAAQVWSVKALPVAPLKGAKAGAVHITNAAGSCLAAGKPAGDAAPVALGACADNAAAAWYIREI